jgi:hypothetical protein
MNRRKIKMTTYFEQIILPSTNMPKQESYSIDEAVHILDVPVKQVKKFASNHENQKGQVRLKIENGTVSYDTFVEFFG